MSGVSYRGYLLQPLDLISMRAILIEKSIETMKKSGAYFRAIMPPKIFADMYQFYQSKANVIHQP